MRGGRQLPREDARCARTAAHLDRVGALRSEDGMALPLALVVVLVLTISVFSVIDFSSANVRNANLDIAHQRAKATAEGGFNSAVSILAAAPTTATLPGPCSSDVWSTWVEVAAGEEVRWCGAYDSITQTWTVKGQGRVANPTGPSAAARVSTVEAQLELTQDAGAWNFVWVRPMPGTCMLIKNSFVMEAPLYVKGDLCIDNEARYGGPRLYVTGTVQTQNTGSVGAAAAPVPKVSVRNNAPSASGCRYTSSGVFAL